MPAGLGVGVGEFGQIWARVCKDDQIWMGQTNMAEGAYLAVRYVCACKSRDGCWLVWVHNLVAPTYMYINPHRIGLQGMTLIVLKEEEIFSDICSRKVQ